MAANTSESIVLGLSALESILALLVKLRSTAQQAGEWTPEQETDFQNRLDTVTSQEHWKIQP